MQTLTLLRHAKSGYVDGLTDFKRHLSERGRRDAHSMARVLRERGCTPTALIVSSAVRTRETAQIVRDVLGLSESIITHSSDLYLASPDVLEREINQADDTPHLLLIGHNPGLESLSGLLDPESPERMSTCSVNHFTLIKAAVVMSGDLQASPKANPDTHVSQTQRVPDEPHEKQGKTRIRMQIRGDWNADFVFHESPSG